MKITESPGVYSVRGLLAVPELIEGIGRLENPREYLGGNDLSPASFQARDQLMMRNEMFAINPTKRSEFQIGFGDEFGIALIAIRAQIRARRLQNSLNPKVAAGKIASMLLYQNLSLIDAHVQDQINQMMDFVDRKGN